MHDCSRKSRGHDHQWYRRVWMFCGDALCCRVGWFQLTKCISESFAWKLPLHLFFGKRREEARREKRGKEEENGGGCYTITVLIFQF